VTRRARQRDPLASFNERVKILAQFLNAIALGAIGFAVLRPLTESLSNWDLNAFWWLIVGLAIHGVAHYVLRYMHKEDGS